MNQSSGDRSSPLSWKKGLKKFYSPFLNGSPSPGEPTSFLGLQHSPHTLMGPRGPRRVAAGKRGLQCTPPLLLPLWCQGLDVMGHHYSYTHIYNI